MKLQFMRKLCMVLCCTLLSLNMFAQDIEITFESFDYLLHEDGTATFVGVLNEYPGETPERTGEIIIPASVTQEGRNYRVTEIGMYALRRLGKITSVILPKGITKIGHHAFEGCSSITSITLPETIAYIDNEVFIDCTSLAEIIVPNSVEYIGTDVFKKTAWYDNLPEGLVYVNHILYGYKGVMQKGTAVEIKEGTTYIAVNALAEKSLVSVTLPASLKKLGSGAFFNCRNLEEITLPKNLEYIGKNAFRGTKITKLIIPAKVSYIDSFVEGFTLKELYFLGSTPPKTGEGYEPSLMLTREGAYYIPFRSFIEYYKARVIPPYSIGEYFHVKTLEGEEIYGIQAKVANPEENGGKVLINGREQEIVGALWGAKNISIEAIANEGYEIDNLLVGSNSISPVGMTSFVQEISTVNKYVSVRVSFKKKSNIDSISGQTEEGVRVYASEGKLKIENVRERVPVAVFSLEGRMVYQGMTDSFQEVSLPAGMYVVKVDTETYKVAVK